MGSVDPGGGTPGGPGGRRDAAGPGDITVFVADEQAEVAVDVERYRGLAEHALRARGVRGDVELSLLFVDRATIADLNRRFLDGDGPTDVLAFPIDEGGVEPGRTPDNGSAGPARESGDLEDVPVLLGDVVVCPGVAADNVRARSPAEGEIPAAALDAELALLVVHGILHILGMDHATPAEEQEMRRAEAELLTTWPGHGGAA